MNTLAGFQEINTFIFDVDGVLTNGQLLVTESGELLRSMNAKDGYALRAALEQGYTVIIITGGGSQGVKKRLKGLGIEYIFDKVYNKLEQFNQIVSQLSLDTSKVLYMGDDLVDYQVMQTVGLPTCPKDAVPEIIEISQYVSPKSGGLGCVRDVIEKVLKLNSKWPAQHL